MTCYDLGILSYTVWACVGPFLSGGSIALVCGHFLGWFPKLLLLCCFLLSFPFEYSGVNSLIFSFLTFIPCFVLVLFLGQIEFINFIVYPLN